MLLLVVVYLTLSAFCIRLLAKKFWKNLTKHKRLLQAVKDVGCVKKHWLWGHAHMFTLNEAGLKAFANVMKTFPKCTQRWFGPMTFVLSAYHPHFAKPLLSSNEPKNESLYRFLRPWVGDGLLTSQGPKWKQHRKLLTPAFHFGALKMYMSFSNAAALNMAEEWSKKTKNGVAVVEIFHEVGMVTLDNLLQCIYSKPPKNNIAEDLKYLEATKVLTEGFMHRMERPYLASDFVFFLSPMGRRYKRALQTAHNYTEKAIRERKLEIDSKSKAGIPHNSKDFLDLLLTARDENGMGLSSHELRDELDTFQFAGFDTLSSGISWCMYNLAKYPEYQEECRAEVSSLLQDRDTLNWEDLSKLVNLTMFLKESMRLYPPVIAVGRVLSKPVTFPRCFGSDQYKLEYHSKPTADASRTLPADMPVNVDIYMLHRNPAVWHDPENFDPDRFTPENVAKRPPHSYVPFSSGPRNCIGRHFAMNSMKAILAVVLKRFRLEIDHTHPKPIIERRVILHSTNGIHLKISAL